MHVGAEQTFGQADEGAAAPQSQQTQLDDWQERYRAYPTESGGHEQYGEGHQHGGDDEHWPLGQAVESQE